MYWLQAKGGLKDHFQRRNLDKFLLNKDFNLPFPLKQSMAKERTFRSVHKS